MSFDAEAAAREVILGQQAWLAGDHGAAVVAWEAAREFGADSADLHFRLGNAWYRLGQQGRAALSYEKALRREPGNPDAKANLQLVRAQVTEVRLDPGLTQRVGERVSPNDAGVVLLLAASLACSTWLVRRFFGAQKWLAGLAAAVFLIVALVAGFATWASWDVRQAGWAVVLESGPLLHAPEPSSRSIATTREAQRLRLVGRIGGFAKVELPSGAIGWVPIERVEPID